MYLLGYKGSTSFNFDPSYAIYDLTATDVSNSRVIPSTTFDRSVPNSMNQLLAGCSFDSNNNVYYMLADGLYKAPIYPSGEFNIPGKTKLLSFTNINHPWMIYNSFIDELCYNFNGIKCYDIGLSSSVSGN